MDRCCRLSTYRDAQEYKDVCADQTITDVRSLVRDTLLGKVDSAID